MPDPLDTTDVHELHELVRQLQSSRSKLDDTIADLETQPCEDFRTAALHYLAAYQSYRLGTPEELEGHLQALPGPGGASDKLTDYFIQRGLALQARHFWRLGNLPVALRHAKMLQGLADTCDVHAVKAEALCLISLVYAASCKWSDAAEIALLAMAALRRGQEDALGEAAAWFALGHADFNAGKFGPAGSHLDTSFSLYSDSRLPDIYGQIEARLLSAHLCYSGGDYEDHDRLLATIEPLCAASKYLRGSGKVSRYRGKLALRRARVEGVSWEPARDLFQKSLEEFTEVNDPAGMAKSHLSLARAFAFGGDTGIARTHYEMAKKGFLTCDDAVRHAMASITEGLVDGREESRPSRELEEVFEQNIQVFRSLGDRRHLSAALYDVAMLYRWWGDETQGTAESMGYSETAAHYIREAIDTASAMQAEHLVRRFKEEARLTALQAKWSAAVLTSAGRIRLLVEFFAHDLLKQSLAVWDPLTHLGAKIKGSPHEEMISEIEKQAEVLRLRSQGLEKLWGVSEFKTDWVLDRRVTRLLPIVTEAVAMVATRDQPKVTFLTDVPPGLSIFADCDQLKCVLVNLLTSARLFVGAAVDVTEFSKGQMNLCAEGRISVCAEKQEGAVRITVRDNGPGMPHELRNLDEPLAVMKHMADHHHGLKSGKKDLRGYDISYIYCCLVVEEHGGEMWVDEEETRRFDDDDRRDSDNAYGTVIHFTLPDGPGHME